MTTNLRLAERGFFPTIGGDDDTWGEKLDSTFEEIERVLPAFADAFGDGLSSTDSAQNCLTIQAAIDYKAANGGGPVLVHQGTWPIERSAPGQAWGVQLKSGVTLRGCGRTVTTLKLADGQVDFIRPISTAPGAVAPQVMDLTIDGNKANQTSTFEHQAGIYIDYGTDCLVERVEVKNTVGDCINLGTSLQPERAVRSVIRDAWLHEPIRVGIHAQYYTSATIDNVRIWGLTGQSCIKGEIDNELGAIAAEGLTITNSVFQGDGSSGTFGVLLSGASLTTPIQVVTVTNNEFFDLSGGGVSIGIASHGWLVNSNLFERCNRAVAVSSYSTKYGYIGHIGVTVNGNLVRNATNTDASQAQIHISNATDVTALGNTIQGAGILAATRFEQCNILKASNTVQGGTGCTGVTVYRCKNAKAQGGEYYCPGGIGVSVLNAAIDEEQVVTVSNATGGTFTLTFGVNTTSALSYHATAADMDTALEALASIGAGNVIVSGGWNGTTLSPWTVTFTGALAGTTVAQMTANGASLTGPAPTVSVTTQTAGDPAPMENVSVGDISVTGPATTGVSVGSTPNGQLTLGTIDAPGATNVVTGYSQAKGNQGFRTRVPVVATASLPAASATRDGCLIIEDNGTGDRNLIVYAGAQRFRIDGGASF
jgi:hypothetical protein